MLVHPAFISFGYDIVEAVHDELSDLGISQIDNFYIRILSSLE